jgi:hypothetical protein
VLKVAFDLHVATLLALARCDGCLDTHLMVAGGLYSVTALRENDQERVAVYTGAVDSKPNTDCLTPTGERE